MTGTIRVTTVVVATAVFMALAIGFFGWSNERQAQFTCEGGTHVAQPYDRKRPVYGKHAERRVPLC